MRVLPAILSIVVASSLGAQEAIPYIETIEVVRYALDVRVTDSFGQAITDLTAADFDVRVRGKEATVESAMWIGYGHSAAAPEPEATGAETTATLPVTQEAEPRSIVLFIQTDVFRNEDRILGQMKFNAIARRMMKMFGPKDRIAVVSHDSHLKFRREFTYDHESVREGVKEALFADTPPLPAGAADGSSLAGLLDPTEMKRAHHGEAALAVVAKALRRVPGAKLIILASWGMGELQGKAGVQLKPQWGSAVKMLHEERVPVIALNTGWEAQLSGGLMATAAATGGVYLGTGNFGDHAYSVLQGALAGHYSLTLRIGEPLSRGSHPLTVRVKRKGAEAEAPAFVLGGG